MRLLFFENLQNRYLAYNLQARYGLWFMVMLCVLYPDISSHSQWSSFHYPWKRSAALCVWAMGTLPVPSVVNLTIRLTYCSTIITGYLQELFTHNSNLTDTFMFRKKFGLLIANQIQFHLCSKGYKSTFLTKYINDVCI